VNVIGSKWVFKAKKDATGNIAHYKVRLVSQGFSQIGGVDYDDTYAPVVKMASSRAIIAMANKLGLVLHQLDIKGAYLNRVLNKSEVLYMAHALGYKPSDVANCVLRLLKAIYGLNRPHIIGIKNFAKYSFLWATNNLKWTRQSFTNSSLKSSSL